MRATCKFLSQTMDNFNGAVPVTVDLVLMRCRLHVGKSDVQLEVLRGEPLKGIYYQIISGDVGMHNAKII